MMRQILCFAILVAIGVIGADYLGTHPATRSPLHEANRPAFAAGRSTAKPTPDSCMQMSERSRGWCLFASLVGDENGPAWQTWSPVPAEGAASMPCTSNAALQPESEVRFSGRILAREASARLAKVRFLRTLSQPAQLILPGRSRGMPGKLSATNLNLLTAAAVLYNDPLNAAVCGLRPSGGSLRDALSAPSDSGMVSVRSDKGVEIAVKTVWASVPITANSLALKVWDHQPLDGKPNPVVGWKTAARLDPTHPYDCVMPGRLDPNKWPPFPPPISLGCFYYLTVQQADLDNLTKKDAAIINQAAAGVAVDRAYLVLMGFHVAARATNSTTWTWQTYWWSGATFDAQDAESPLLAGNPLQDQPKWSHYVMRTMADDQRFNPYLEAQLPNGQDSDCVSCHSSAAYHASPPNTSSQVTAWFQRAQDCALAGPCNAIPKGLHTDSLWTLGDSNVAGRRHAD